MFGSLVFAIIWMSQPLLVGHDVALRWSQGEGAATCITDRELAAAVTARLGGASGRARIVIDGEIATTASGWTAAIRTADDHGIVLGQRELHEPTADCHAIDDKLVLVIALIIDPDLLDEAPVPVVVTKRVVPIVPHEPWRFGAGVAALAARGMLPGFGFGTSIVGMVEPPHVWPIELGATLWPRDRATASPGGANLLQLTGGVAVCPQLVGPVSACVGVQAGEVRAQGFGYSQNQLQHELLVDGTLGLRLDWRFGRDSGARFGAGAWIPVSRPRFVFREANTDVMVYQPTVAAAVSEIALWTRF